MSAISRPGPRAATVSEVKVSCENGISGTRAIQSSVLRPGLVLSITDSCAQVSLKAAFDMDVAPVQFGFTQCGMNRCRYRGGSLRNETHEMRSGTNGIYHLQKTSGVIEHSQDHPPTIMGIITSPEFLLGYYADCANQLPRTLRRNLEGGSLEPMTWFGSDTPAKRSLVAQIMSCPYSGGLRRMYLESRALDLLTLQLSEYVDIETRRPVASQVLGPEGVERIRHAKDILVSDLENPPSLPELAKLAGVNERKLKSGFRQVYGTSVFGYYREYRLQKAYEILQEGRGNVTEAAYAIGYQSLSHFSQAFKDRFDILPKDLLAGRRRLLAQCSE